MIKKIIFLIFIVGHISFASMDNFIDVHPDTWYYKDLSYAYENGWVQGFQDQTFRPNDYMTRLEALHITLKMMGHYPDADDLWDEWTLENAEIFGLTFDREYMDYNQDVSRQEMIQIGLRATDVSIEDDLYKYSLVISDFDDIEFYWQPIILRAYSLGLIKGYDDKSVRAEMPLKRSEGIVILNRVYKYIQP